MVKIGAPRLRRLMRAPNHKTLIKTFTAVIRTDDLQRVCFFARLARSAQQPAFGQPVTLDDHSKVVPRLPIPNRIVKRLSADDSWHSPVKVGHRQALTPQSPCIHWMQGLCLLGASTTTVPPSVHTPRRLTARRHAYAAHGPTPVPTPARRYASGCGGRLTPRLGRPWQEAMKN